MKEVKEDIRVYKPDIAAIRHNAAYRQMMFVYMERLEDAERELSIVSRTQTMELVRALQAKITECKVLLGFVDELEEYLNQEEDDEKGRK